MVSLASWLHWVPKKSHQRLSVLGADFQRCFPSQKNHSRQVRRMIEGDTCHDSFSWSGQFQDRIFPFFFPFMYVGGMPKPWFYWEFMESTVNQWVFGHKMYEWLIFEVHFHVRLRGWGLPILRVFFVPSSLKGYPFIINIYIYIQNITITVSTLETSHLQLPQTHQEQNGWKSGHEQSCPLWSGQKVFCGFDFQPTSGSFSLKNGWFFIASRVRIDRLFRGRNYQVAFRFFGRFLLGCFPHLGWDFFSTEMGEGCPPMFGVASLFASLEDAEGGKCDQWLCSWGDFTPSYGLNVPISEPFDPGFLEKTNHSKRLLFFWPEKKQRKTQEIRPTTIALAPASLSKKNERILGVFPVFTGVFP